MMCTSISGVFHDVHLCVTTGAAVPLRGRALVHSAALVRSVPRTSTAAVALLGSGADSRNARGTLRGHNRLPSAVPASRRCGRTEDRKSLSPDENLPDPDKASTTTNRAEATTASDRKPCLFGAWQNA